MSAVKQLGYLAFEVSDVAAWEDFGTKILGLDVVDRRGDAGFSLRMDSYHQRFFIEHGRQQVLRLNLLIAVGRCQGLGILDQFL